MSASITIHPASRDLMAAVDWGYEMLFLGYEVRALRLSQGGVTITAWPSETRRSNENILKRPRYRNQIRNVRLSDEPPPAA